MSKKSGRSEPARRGRIKSVHVDRIAERLADQVLKKPDILSELEVAAIDPGSTTELDDSEWTDLERAVEVDAPELAKQSAELPPGDEHSFSIEVVSTGEDATEPAPTGEPAPADEAAPADGLDAVTEQPLSATEQPAR